MQTGMSTKIRRIIGDLHHQFTGRRQHQRARLTDETTPLLRIAHQVINDSNQKRGRLAGASLRLASDVITDQRIAQALRLDWGTVIEPQIRNGTGQLRHQVELTEWDFYRLGYRVGYRFKSWLCRRLRRRHNIRSRFGLL